MPGRSRTTNEERFQTKFVAFEEGCWQWTGTTHANGYGLFDVRLDTGKWRKVWAHRYSFEFHVRALVNGETVDHLCNNHGCVNPAHLEGVSSGVNSRRSPRTLQGRNARKTHCPQGHPYAGENVFLDQGKRRCRICVRAKNRLADARRRAANRSTALQ